jgi:arginine-tRNA-protein transferase
MEHNLLQRPTSFFVTSPLPCPYLTGRVERRIVAELMGRDRSSLHDLLSRVGFRRSHGIIYAPACPDCQACLAVRTVVEGFRASRSQRRVQRVNDDLVVRESQPLATEEQYALFSRYQESRHAGGDMAGMDFYDYQALVEETPVESALVEFALPDGTLIGTCLIDWMGDGASAVYSFFEPDKARRSLGTFMVLWLIERARELGRQYVYLGYWIGGSPKMSYKEKFQPLEFYQGDGWRPFRPESERKAG